ncbi:MAG: hypothetical protein EBZ29_10385 [Synechococcaceae bacterium WB9_4xC_028]|nr:hypothetical protein [Synechococcaceae bacterium WB9_4xC_028]
MVKPLATVAACIGAAVAALYWGQGYIIGFIYGQAMKSYRAAEEQGKEAYCLLSRHDHTLQVEQGPCAFRERHGDVTVTMKPYGTFSFEAKPQGISHQQANNADGIRFNKEGEFTLQVLWRKPLQCSGPITAPVSVVFLNKTNPPSVNLAIGEDHLLLPIARSGSGARYSAGEVELWEHQGSTRINWLGQILQCTTK